MYMYLQYKYIIQMYMYGVSHTATHLHNLPYGAAVHVNAIYNPRLTDLCRFDVEQMSGLCSHGDHTAKRTGRHGGDD